VTTLELPHTPAVTLAHLRHWNVPVALLVIPAMLVAWFVGQTVVGAHREQARVDAAVRLEVARRVDALSADWLVEQDFMETAQRAAATARVATFAAEHAALLAARDQTLAVAAGALASSTGKVDEQRRAELAAAAGTLAATDDVHTHLVAATGNVAALTAQVTQAEADWTAEQARLAAAAAAAPRASTHHAARSVAAGAPAAGSVEDAGEAELRSLPGNAGVTIHWNDPDLSGHLGAVWSGTTGYIMVNSAAMAGQPGKVRDVVRHELAHIYQGRVAKANGLSWGALGDRMSGAFGANPQEKAADCVALRFGASWTHYTSDCSAPEKQAWVDAMIGGYLP